MAIDFDIKDPKNQKLIMTFLIPVVILAAFYNFFIKPKSQELNNKKNELSNLQAQIEKVQGTLQSKEDLQKTRENLMAKFKELDALLPREENVAALLDQILMVEKDSKVFVVGFNAAETIEGDGKPYRANKYRITIEAGFHQFATFMSRIMALPRILSFSELRIMLNPAVSDETKDYEGLEDQPRNLTIECIVTSYVFKPPNDKS